MMEFFRGSVTKRDLIAVGAIVAVTVILCAAFFFLLYKPQLAEIARVQAEDQQVFTKLKQARETEKNIDALRAEAAKMDELVTQFEQRLPESREIPLLLQQFEGFAREIKLQVELEQLPRITDDRKETIPYNVVARGNFHQIVLFINRLERFQRYLKVSDLDIAEEEKNISEATFTLSTFRFIQSSEGEAS